MLHRYPVLLAIDDFQSLYSQSKYRDARFNTLKAYHLSLPRLLLEFASGRQQFVRKLLSRYDKYLNTSLYSNQVLYSVH